jgi:hypothetical protein
LTSPSALNVEVIYYSETDASFYVPQVITLQERDKLREERLGLNVFRNRSCCNHIKEDTSGDEMAVPVA